VGQVLDVVDMEAVPLFLQQQARNSAQWIVEKGHAYWIALTVGCCGDTFA